MEEDFYMKEKIGKKGIAKRLFSVVLALAMVVALMPINSLTVYARDWSLYAIEYKNGAWHPENLSNLLAVGDTLEMGSFNGKVNSEVIYCDGQDVQTAFYTLSGTIVKIDGDKLYLCTASDHEAKKAANDLCPKCDPDGGSGSGTNYSGPTTIQGVDITVTGTDWSSPSYGTWACCSAENLLLFPDDESDNIMGNGDLFTIQDIASGNYTCSACGASVSWGAL